MLVLGSVVLSVAAVWMWAVAADEHAGLWHRVDLDTLDYLNRYLSGHRGQVDLWLCVSFLGDPTAWRVVTVVVLSGLVVTRRWARAVVIVVAAAGAQLLIVSIKALVGRSRPLPAYRVMSFHADRAGTGRDFPSGHAVTSVVAIGLIVTFMWPRLSSTARTLVVCAALFVVAVIGFSRLVLGVHFLTDVLSGWLVGGCWLYVVALAWRRVDRSRGPCLWRRAESPAAHV